MTTTQTNLQETLKTSKHLSSMKVKNVLISLPEPKNDSPYNELSSRNNVKIDFRPFSVVEGVSASDVRKQKIDFKNYTAVIFTSKNAVDNYFRLAEELRFKIPDDMKYFCQNEAVAFYMQKYIVYRKRKIYVGDKTFQDLIKLLKKHKAEKFLYPTSETVKQENVDILDSLGLSWERVVLYNNIYSDIKDLYNKDYDIIVFFSPKSIEAWFNNFPDFKQEKTKIAAFGVSTIKQAEKRGLSVDIPAPTPQMPSMTMALEDFIKKYNK